MKTLLCALAFIAQIALSPMASAALPEIIHYWGMADHTPKGGQVVKVWVLGTRVEDRKAQTISDTQLYVGESGSVSETKFVFDFKAKTLTAFEGDKTVGHGTIDCNGTVEKHTNCNYKYETTGSDSYKAVGKDTLGKNGVLYREQSDITYASSPKAIPYVVDYFAIKPEAYTTLRTKLLAK
jgi:hypothetical protein